jgi:hypothetical protein
MLMKNNPQLHLLTFYYPFHFFSFYFFLPVPDANNHTGTE